MILWGSRRFQLAIEQRSSLPCACEGLAFDVHGVSHAVRLKLGVFAEPYGEVRGRGRLQEQGNTVSILPDNGSLSQFDL